MVLSESIGARVFGLAVTLLLLTIALVGFLLWHVSQLQDELHGLTHRDIPLANSLSRVDEYGLRRRLAFERMFGTLNLASPNEQILEEARTNYDLFTQKLQDEFRIAEGLLSGAERGAADSAELSAMSKLLDQVEAAYPPITARQQEVLDLQREGNHEQANLVVNSLNDLQRLVQTQRTELQGATAQRAERLSRDALVRQDRITTLSIATTASAVLLGLAFAAWVTRGLVRPVRRLIAAMGAVQQGRLDIELPEQGGGEIGALTAAFNFFVRELRSKARMKETFGRYVDPRILERLLESASPADGGGDRQVMTVSFGDLVGFADSSERIMPANMVRMLNRHFGLQAQAIQDHLGIVDKFIGDAVMAFWGPPFVSPGEHTILACRSALAQIAALDALRQEVPELTGLRRGAPSIDLRIGLAAGEVIVGNLGAEQTRNYTVIGDTVNIASRIESANRHYGTRILMNDAAAAEVASQFELREIDTITVKGRQEQTSIFELLGPAGCLDPAAQRARESHAAGLRAYREGQWDAASAGFQACLASNPEDQAAQVMLQRIAQLRARPADEPWHGVWNLTEKQPAS